MSVPDSQSVATQPDVDMATTTSVPFSEENCSVASTSGTTTTSPSPQTPTQQQDYIVDRQFLALTLAAAAKAATFSSSPQEHQHQHSYSSSQTRRRQLQQQQQQLQAQLPPRTSSPSSPSHFPSSPTASVLALSKEEFDIVHYPIKHTTLIVSVLLSSMVRTNDQQYNPLVDPITLFHARAVARISIEAYLSRILQYIPFSNEVLLNVLVYLDRIGGLSGMEQICSSNQINNQDGSNGGGHVGLEEQQQEEEQDSPQESTAPSIPLRSNNDSHINPLTNSCSSSSSSWGVRSNEFSTSTARSSPTSVTTTITTPISSQPTNSCSISNFSSTHASQPPRSGSPVVPPASSTRATTTTEGTISVDGNIQKDPAAALPAAPTSFTSSLDQPPHQPNSDCPMIQKRGRAEEQEESTTNQPTTQISYPRPTTTACSSSSSSSTPSSSSSSHMTEPRPQIARGSPPPSREGRRSGSPSEEDENCPPGHKRNMDNEYKDLDRVQHVPKKAKLGGDVTTVASTSTPTTTTAKLSQDSNVSVTAVQQQQQNTDCSSSSSSSSSSTSSDCPNGSWTPAPTPVMAMTSNGFRINSFNIHRLLIVCLMVAAKFTSDHFYSNGRYAKVGGLSLLELNQLELEFLFTIRFELNVKEEELQRVGNALLRFRDKEMTPAPQKGQARTMTEARAMPTSVPVSVSSATATIAESHRPAINTATGQHTEPVDTHLVEAQPQEQQRQQQQQQQHHHHHQPQPPQQQKPKTGRFSIPSPTSPKNGPMSDRSGPGTNSAPTAGTSQEHANVGTSASVTSIGMGHTVAATANAPTTDSSNDTVVVASGRGPSARPQLLSPPAERQRKKDDSEIQGSERSEGSSVEMDRSMDGSSSIVTQEL